MIHRIVGKARSIVRFDRGGPHFGDLWILPSDNGSVAVRRGTTAIRPISPFDLALVNHFYQMLRGSR